MCWYRPAYVDNTDAESAVRLGIDAVDSAELTVGDAQDHDVAWYASQELPFLLDRL